MSLKLSDIVRIVEVSAPPSERLLRACAAFGLAVRHTPNCPRAGRPARLGDARAILSALGPGRLALITGPSGGGKSSLLEDIRLTAQLLGQGVLRLPDAPTEPNTPIIDLFNSPLAESLATLARAGLADAMLLGRSPAQLSDGERFRLRLALAMSESEGSGIGGRSGERDRPLTILIDEFASTLDRTTARCLCRALRRWLASQAAPRRDIRLIVATGHSDVGEWLQPDLVAVVPLGQAPIEFTHAPARATKPSTSPLLLHTTRERAA